MKAVLFARVSSREQEETGYSLESQKKLLKDYAGKKEFSVAKIFSISESASKEYARKEFYKMLDYIKKNNVNVIVCEKVDRLTRNMKSAGIIDDWVKEGKNREVHFIKENFILNCNTKAHENLVWDMKVAIARFYANNLSEEVKKGQKEKIAQGWIPCRAKLGYKTVGEKGHKTHVIDEEKAPFVRKVFEFYDTGNYSLKALVEKAHQDGLRTNLGNKLVKSRMADLLVDPFYAGKIMWNGEIYEGKHEPLISQELFDAIQKRLKRKGKSPQYKKHLPVFKAKIFCEECGGTITWEVQKGHWYGHCNHYKNCSQKVWVRQEAVEEQLFPYFDKIAPKNERIIKWLEKALKEHHADEVDYNARRREELNAIIKQAETRQEKAYKDKLDGKIPAQLCEKMIFDSDAERKEAVGALDKLGEARLAYYEAGYAIHELALHAREIYQSEQATTEDKRILLSQIFSNLTFKDGFIKPNYTLAFDFLSNWMPKVNKNFEPAVSSPIPLVEATKNGAFSPEKSPLLRR